MMFGGVEILTWGYTREHLLEAYTEHLAALVEHGLHQSLEEFLITTQVGHLVTGHADDGTLHLWRWIEHALIYGEEILHIIPCLDEHAEDAIRLVARLGSHAQMPPLAESYPYSKE